MRRLGGERATRLYLLWRHRQENTRKKKLNFPLAFHRFSVHVKKCVYVTAWRDGNSSKHTHFRTVINSLQKFLFACKLLLCCCSVHHCKQSETQHSTRIWIHWWIQCAILNTAAAAHRRHRQPANHRVRWGNGFQSLMLFGLMACHDTYTKHSVCLSLENLKSKALKNVTCLTFHSFLPSDELEMEARLAVLFFSSLEPCHLA